MHMFGKRPVHLLMTTGIAHTTSDNGPVDKFARNQISVEDVEGRIAVQVNRRVRKARIEQIVPSVVPQAG